MLAPWGSAEKTRTPGRPRGRTVQQPHPPFLQLLRAASGHPRASASVSLEMGRDPAAPLSGVPWEPRAPGSQSLWG